MILGGTSPARVGRFSPQPREQGAERADFEPRPCALGTALVAPRQPPPASEAREGVLDAESGAIGLKATVPVGGALMWSSRPTPGQGGREPRMCSQDPEASFVFRVSFAV